MKKYSAVILSLIMASLFFSVAGCKQEDKQPAVSKQTAQQMPQEEMGKQLFHEHCAMCHSDGGRMKDMTSPGSIVNTMRNPKDSMPKFSESEIPNDAAEAIAKYVFFSVLLKK